LTVTAKAPSLEQKRNQYWGHVFFFWKERKKRATLCPGDCIDLFDNISRILFCLRLCCSYIVPVEEYCSLWMKVALSSLDWTVLVFLEKVQTRSIYEEKKRWRICWSTGGVCGFFAVANLLFRFAHDRRRLIRIDLAIAVLLRTVARVAKRTYRML